MNIHGFLCIFAILCICGAVVLAIIMVVAGNKRTSNGIVSNEINNDDDEANISEAIAHLKICNSFKE